MLVTPQIRAAAQAIQTGPEPTAES